MAETVMFYGDGRVTENPQDYKKKVQQRHVGKGMSDEEKMDSLGLGMASESAADDWFDAERSKHKTWKDLAAAFDAKWPKRKAVTRKGQEAVTDLMALAETLSVEDIGKRVTDGGIEQLAHVVWIRKIKKVADDIPDTPGNFIGPIREKLPTMMQDLLGATTTYADWVAFEKAFLDIPMSAITLAQKKEARFTKVESARATPAIPTRQRDTLNARLPQYGVGPPRYAPQAYVYPVIPPPTQPGHPAPQPPTYRPYAERLANVVRNALPQHPPTAEGNTAYQQQLRDWHARHGTQQPNELRPYPLRPGTATLNASNECFKCALTGHRSLECPNPEMPPLEKKWRQIASSIRKGASGMPRANNLVAEVRYVVDQPVADNFALYDYNTASWVPQTQYAPIYTMPDEQGKDLGSSQ
ncbi:hypothetical protein C8F01DRAFT_1126567 [Mycena amicta]|nr:hypothetical protein C8F01DRAFT_1126567 [Mycena amicta]